jgi:hypothetical protein
MRIETGAEKPGLYFTNTRIKMHLLWRIEALRL